MRVDQVMLLYIVFEAVEISGDVAWWLRFVVILVGVFVITVFDLNCLLGLLLGCLYCLWWVSARVYGVH